MVKPALRSALSALLPEPTETLLLQACLGDGDQCTQAWLAFQRRGKDLLRLFRTDQGGRKRLGPLLLQNLSRNRVPLEGDLQTVLRMSYFREQLRARTYREVLAQVLRALRSAGLDYLAIRGAALGETVYGDPALRHSHDIEVLLCPEDLGRAVEALENQGFAEEEEEDPPRLTHPTSLPVVLHTSPSRTSQPGQSWAQLWSRSIPTTLADEPARILSPEDSLALALLRAAFSPSRLNLQWACDAWKIAATRSTLSPQWIIQVAAESHLLSSAAVLLGCLHGLGAPLAPGFMAAVEGAADAASPFDRDLGLFGLRQSIPGGLRSVLRRMPNARARLALVGWVLFPSIAYLRRAHRPRYRALAPAYYVVRMLRSLRWSLGSIR